MALVSLIAVLLIEQLKPLPYRAMVFAPLSRLARVLEERFNAGEPPALNAAEAEFESA